MSRMPPVDQNIVNANVEVHTAMAATYDETEPHFLPENRQKVRANLERLRGLAGPRLLDVGCGTGFVIGLAADLFSEIHGVDITQAMLDRVNRAAGNVTLHRSLAESMPFPDAGFDAATAYSFIHHLGDYSLVLREVHRVLRPGGVFYVDLDPNRAFWSAIADAESALARAGAGATDIVAREIESVLRTDDRVEREFNIPAQTFNLAEHYKDIRGGIDAGEFADAARGAGFASCEVRYEWYLGQGAVLHGQSPEDATRIEAYLRRALPVSAPLFKYLQFWLVR
jgi:ubiquinone/menaquinone biosynthesis C-methylase UbiE